jgi:N1221-like protein
MAHYFIAPTDRPNYIFFWYTVDGLVKTYWGCLSLVNDFVKYFETLWAKPNPLKALTCGTIGGPWERCVNLCSSCMYFLVLCIVHHAEIMYCKAIIVTSVKTDVNLLQYLLSLQNRWRGGEGVIPLHCILIIRNKLELAKFGVNIQTIISWQKLS